MSMQTEMQASRSYTEIVLNREAEELLIVAEGFVLNAWRIIAGEIGILPQVNHDLAQSTMTELGELAVKLIPDYSHYEAPLDQS